MAARFFMEPYLWMVCAVVATDWTRSRGVLFRLLVLQAALMVCIVGYGAWRLFPGSFSHRLRDRVMRTTAANYTEAAWADEVLPPNAIILSRMRSHALFPRPFVNLESYLSPPGSAFEIQKMRNLINIYGVTVVILDPIQDKLLIEDLKHPVVVAGPKIFRVATRNPRNIGIEYSVQMYGTNGGNN